MNPDELRQAWQTQAASSQSRVDPDLCLQEVRRKQRHFAATIFWRDVREVGTSLLLVPVWFYIGFKQTMPWTWYLMVPALVGIAAFMLIDRLRQSRQRPEPGESLRQYVASSLAQVEHQIWLLRNVFWWYLLPLIVAILPFLGQVSWEQRSTGWLTITAFAGALSIVTGVLFCVYRMNQAAVRCELMPRRQELEALLQGLQ